MNNAKMHLGKIISEYRKEHNLSMGDFSKMANMSKAYVCQLEKNINTRTEKQIIPSLKTVRDCAAAMNMDTNALVNMIGKELDANEKIKADKIETMAKNIQYYLDKKGKDRNEMCCDLGFKYTTVSNWLQGVKYPRIEKIELMAQYFGITINDLIEDHLNFSDEQLDKMSEERLKERLKNAYEKAPKHIKLAIDILLKPYE